MDRLVGLLICELQLDLEGTVHALRPSGDVVVAVCRDGGRLLVYGRPGCKAGGDCSAVVAVWGPYTKGPKEVTHSMGSAAMAEGRLAEDYETLAPSPWTDCSVKVFGPPDLFWGNNSQ